VRSHGFRVLLGVAACLLAVQAGAQDYPTRTITLVNPAAAGGSNEALKSIIFDRVAAALGVPIIMESRSGAGGAIAAAYVAKAPADGYTLMLAGGSVLATLPVTKKDLPYEPLRDFTPIVTLITTAPLLVVPTSTPATSAKEFVDLARAHPGKLDYGSYGRGTTNYFAFELFKHVAGIDVVGIPYRGSAPLLVALLASEVDAAFEQPPTIRSYLQDGKFRALGIASAERSPMFPGVPTMIEQGYPVSTPGGIILAAPAGLPASIADRLNREVNKVLALPEVRQRILETGSEPGGGTREEAMSWVRSAYESWARMTRDLDYVPD
jgi:tripartite-type tricarboxylate transporter receptor subunit TctC